MQIASTGGLKNGRYVSPVFKLVVGVEERKTLAEQLNHGILSALIKLAS